MTIIQLTATEGQTTIWLDVNDISLMTRTALPKSSLITNYEEKTEIWLKSQRLIFVKETPEEILGTKKY